MRTCLLFLMLWAVNAHAELRLATEEGEPAFTSRETLAVFSPTPKELWVITASGPLLVDRAVAQKAGWQVEPLRVTSGVGVKVITNEAHAWRLRILPWGWKVVTGTGQKLPALKLKVIASAGGVRVEGQNVLSAQSADGRRFWVLPAAGPVAGGLEALSGLAIAADEPKALAKVPVFPATPLPAVTTPTTKVEDIKALAQIAKTEPNLIYRPGQLIAFSLPSEWAMENGKLMPAAEVKRQQNQAQAMGALQVALEETKRVTARLPVKVPVPAAKKESTEVPQPQAETAQSILWPQVADNKQYRPQMQDYLTRLVKASAEEKPRIREDFAIFSLAWGRGSEALVLLAINPIATTRGQLIKALSLIQSIKPEAALLELNQLLAKKGSPLWQTHLQLWRAVALAQTGKSAEALKSWPEVNNQEDLLASYPYRLRDLARMQYATALVEVGDLMSAKAYVDKLAEPYLARTKPVKPEKSDLQSSRQALAVAEAAVVPSALNLLRGLARLNTRDEREGLNILATVAEQRQDMASAYRAKFAFVQALQRRGELAQPQYIRYLSELARFWRGDELEAKTLREVGRQYALSRDYRAALTAWRDLVRAAPNLPDMADLTDQMTMALVAAFDPESPAAYDPLEYLGMYYDFKELIPVDERGDRIAERVADLLLQLGLPERAKIVAEQLLKYRLKDLVAQGRVALIQAQAEREMGDAASSLETLDKWSQVMTTTVQQQQWQVAEARALADLGQLDSAQKVLKDRNDLSVRQVQADVAWQRQDWKSLSQTLQPMVQTINPAMISGSLPLAVLKLAYAEAENRNLLALAKLRKTWSERGGENSAAVFSTLEGALGVTPSAVLAQQPLGQVASSIAGAEQLTERIKDEHRQVQKQRAEQKEYDDKMRYMELLPPPAL